MCTGLPANSDRNTPLVFESPDGIHWNGSPAPHVATLNDRIAIDGYPNSADADINGMNVLFRENDRYFVYFGDFRNFGQVHRASGDDARHVQYEGPVLTGRFAVNDVKKFISWNRSWYLMGLHMNGPDLTYALSTDPAQFQETHTLFSHAGAEDRYIVAIGWVTRGDQETTGRHLLGVLYGAGPVSSLDRNRIFARWLQKRFVFQPKGGSLMEGREALGPDRQRLELSRPGKVEGMLFVYAEDGETLLAESPVILEAGRAYRVSISNQ
jgi:hypothetical protein